MQGIKVVMWQSEIEASRQLIYPPEKLTNSEGTRKRDPRAWWQG